MGNLIMNNIIIVGSQFVDFCDNKKVFLANDFLKMNLDHATPYEVTFGQGLTTEKIKSIRNEMLDIKTNCIFEDDYTNLSQKENVHKHKNENILISKFKKNSEKKYSCSVVVQNNNELISDHVTGIHIPGFILMEAGRQSIISAIEYEGLTDKRFILNSINSEFIKYAFPLPFYLDATINIDGHKSQLSIDAQVKVFQNDSCCANIYITACLVPEKIASFNEQLSKNTLLKKTVGSRESFNHEKNNVRIL